MQYFKQKQSCLERLARSKTSTSIDEFRAWRGLWMKLQLYCYVCFQSSMQEPSQSALNGAMFRQTYLHMSCAARTTCRMSAVSV